LPATYVLEGCDPTALVRDEALQVLPDRRLADTRGVGTEAALRIDDRVVGEQSQRGGDVPSGEGAQELLLDVLGAALRGDSRRDGEKAERGEPGRERRRPNGRHRSLLWTRAAQRQSW